MGKELNEVQKPSISVVSLTWNSEKHIERFIESLIKDTSISNIRIEIFVIDNGSVDATVSLLRKYSQENDLINFIPLSKNMGTTFSRNIGIRCAAGEFVLIIDSDTMISEGTLAGLIEGYTFIEASSRGKIGILHPMLVYPDGRFQESARRFPTFASKLYRILNMETRRKKSESIEKVLEMKISRVDYAISAAWFMKKDLFDKVGFLDEKFFYAPEDAEFCARCWSRGYEVWYYPKVSIIHDCQRLTKRRPFSKLGFIHAKGLIRFWLKYRNDLRINRVSYED